MTTEEKRWWLQAATDDLSAFRSLNRDGNLPLAAFHLQQSAEKMLKALCLHRGRPVFTHSCIELLRKIETLGIEVPERVKAAARRLDPHYILGRYPNGLGGSPRDYYDAAMIEELQQCHTTMTSFAESSLAVATGSSPSEETSKE